VAELTCELQATQELLQLQQEEAAQLTATAKPRSSSGDVPALSGMIVELRAAVIAAEQKAAAAGKQVGDSGCSKAGPALVVSSSLCSYLLTTGSLSRAYARLLLYTTYTVMIPPAYSSACCPGCYVFVQRDGILEVLLTEVQGSSQMDGMAQQMADSTVLEAAQLSTAALVGDQCASCVVALECARSRV
jgi:hypothetical protein